MCGFRAMPGSYFWRLLIELDQVKLLTRQIDFELALQVCIRSVNLRDRPSGSAVIFIHID